MRWAPTNQLKTPQLLKPFLERTALVAGNCPEALTLGEGDRMRASLQ